VDKPRTFQRVLITGMTGSGGSYLAEHIVQNHPEVEVHGLSRWHSTTTSDNLAAIRDRVHVHEADLMDLSSVLAVMDKVKPDAIFHLAAHANVRASFITPHAVLANNILGTSNLFEAVRLARLEPIIQLCSTSESMAKSIRNTCRSWKIAQSGPPVPTPSPKSPKTFSAARTG